MVTTRLQTAAVAARRELAASIQAKIGPEYEMVASIQARAFHPIDPTRSTPRKSANTTAVVPTTVHIKQEEPDEPRTERLKLYLCTLKHDSSLDTDADRLHNVPIKLEGDGCHYVKPAVEAHSLSRELFHRFGLNPYRATGKEIDAHIDADCDALCAAIYEYHYKGVRTAFPRIALAAFVPTYSTSEMRPARL
ncbi:hypothetical protein LTR53_001553 [Teratosphaeriaceae sp. CCFEE 6253]|nr:hypothetical protein LTR53_001553 [Teratosphaeriaceae sp. CCFEE 6253]